LIAKGAFGTLFYYQNINRKKMKTYGIATIWLVLLPILAIAQVTAEFSMASLLPLAGSWHGTLTARDFRDNRTTTAVACSATMRFSELQNFLLMNYVFEDSSGTSEDLFVFSYDPESGHLISQSAQKNELKLWKIEQYLPNPFKLIISAEGLDYGNPAQIQQHFSAQSDTLILRRVVIYPQRKPLIRNEILMTRAKP
jgi:hypothetical protein